MIINGVVFKRLICILVIRHIDFNPDTSKEDLS